MKLVFEQHSRKLFFYLSLFLFAAKVKAIQVEVNLPRVLRQRIDKTFPLKFEASINEELQGPLKFTFVVYKEWFAGYWSTMPCMVDYLKNW